MAQCSQSSRVSAQCSQSQSTLLHAAVDGDHSPTLSLALGLGADPSLRDTDGRTSVLLAAYCGTVGMLDALVARGGDVNAGCEDGAPSSCWPWCAFLSHTL